VGAEAAAAGADGAPVGAEAAAAGAGGPDFPAGGWAADAPISVALQRALSLSALRFMQATTLASLLSALWHNRNTSFMHAARCSGVPSAKLAFGTRLAGSPKANATARGRAARRYPSIVRMMFSLCPMAIIRVPIWRGHALMPPPRL
jgi:hypothetical protein